jgi:hypothetical protein
MSRGVRLVRWMVAMFPSGQVSVKIKSLSLIKQIPIFAANIGETAASAGNLINFIG